MTTASPPHPNDALRSYLEQAVTAGGLRDAEPEPPVTSRNRKRAFRDGRAGSRLATVSLVDEGGDLRWVYDAPPASSRRRARRAGPRAGDRDAVFSFPVREVPPNRVIQGLEALDDRLTPARGLRRWDGKALTPAAKADSKDRTLLLIHGTFSKSDMFFEEFRSEGFEEGPKFLTECQDQYGTILAFDHPTLSVSPWLNALDLDEAMAGVTGPIDVVCHSRGGLVAAWWLHQTSLQVKTVVFVGSPLEGTSLAAPARLKAALDLLGHLARGLGTSADAGATVVPMLSIASGLMKIVGRLLEVGASTPLLDAGVAVVPGLSAQSRVGNNQELIRLLGQAWRARPALHAVTSNYEPPESAQPLWKFWKRFRNIGGQLADWGADEIFDGPNDLVVDTSSMTVTGRQQALLSSTLDLSSKQVVHHCAYFRQKETVDFLRSVLKL